MTDDLWHSPSREHSSFFLHLQVAFLGLVGAAIFVLCDLMIVYIDVFCAAIAYLDRILVEEFL